MFTNIYMQYYVVNAIFSYVGISRTMLTQSKYLDEFQEKSHFLNFQFFDFVLPFKILSSSQQLVDNNCQLDIGLYSSFPVVSYCYVLLLIKI